jgi:hypothetical protein
LLYFVLFLYVSKFLCFAFSCTSHVTMMSTGLFSLLILRIVHLFSWILILDYKMNFGLKLGINWYAFISYCICLCYSFFVVLDIFSLILLRYFCRFQISSIGGRSLVWLIWISIITKSIILMFQSSLQIICKYFLYIVLFCFFFVPIYHCSSIFYLFCNVIYSLDYNALFLMQLWFWCLCDDVSRALEIASGFALHSIQGFWHSKFEN